MTNPVTEKNEEGKNEWEEIWKYFTWDLVKPVFVQTKSNEIVLNFCISDFTDW